MKNLKSLYWILSLIVLMIPLSSIWANGDKPNFVFILTDDHRYDLLGCTGNSLVETPQIDQLAKDGILFTNAHVTSAICTPSRISIFLSQFERKHGVNFNSGTSVSEEAWSKSYPVVMRDNGYYTGYVGKNHAPIGKDGYESGLMESSFDYWYAGHGHLRFYPKKHHSIFKAAKYDTQVEIIDEGVQDFFSNERKLEGAQSFLETRPKDKPFCLSICFNLPHGAGTSTMQQLKKDSSIYRTLYRDLDIPLPNNYVRKDAITEPKLPADLLLAEERQKGYDFVDNEEDLKERQIRQMQAVTGIDGLIGNLRKTLKKQGLDKNTIIVFTSDHGLFMGEFGLGGKAFCYEVTTHVPMIVYNPKAPRKARGKKNNELVQTIDIAPTMLDYASIEQPKAFQGKSIKPFVEGQKVEIHPYLYTENLWSTPFGNPRCEAVQDKEWKYIRYYKNNNMRASQKIATAKLLGIPINDILYKVHDTESVMYRGFVENSVQGELPVYEELYHLSVDPDEVNNLINAAEYAEIIKKLKAVWNEKITYARGTEAPKVNRYTHDSMMKSQKPIKHE